MLPSGTKELSLVLTAQGAGQLCRGDKVLWDSMDDLDWRDEHPDELIREEDVDDVFDYLEEIGMLSPEQADYVAQHSLYVESLEDGEDEDGEDE